MARVCDVARGVACEWQQPGVHAQRAMQRLRVRGTAAASLSSHALLMLTPAPSPHLPRARLTRLPTHLTAPFRALARADSPSCHVIMPFQTRPSRRHGGLVHHRERPGRLY
jgi:hypothetical protein